VRNATERWVGFAAALAVGAVGLAMYAAVPFAPVGLSFAIAGVGGLVYVAVSTLRAGRDD
jgi:hypothetical protein